jgi:hypothetical protein
LGGKKSLIKTDTLKRLGLDTDPAARRPQDQQIVLTNAADVFGALGIPVPW